jgi:hypothetical protein
MVSPDFLYHSRNMIAHPRRIDCDVLPSSDGDWKVKRPGTDRAEMGITSEDKKLRGS